MAPGSSIFEEFPDSQLMDCETTIDFDNAHSFKTSPTSDIKTRISVHELLECPACTNSMYPPIHQVFNCFGQHFCLHFEAILPGKAPVYMAFLCFMGEDNVAKNFSYSLELVAMAASSCGKVSQGALGMIIGTFGTATMV